METTLVTRESDDLVTEVTAEEELESIEGNALASGDDAADKACEDKIRRDLENGNPWAWCTAHVRVTYRGILSADAYLGCCSYADEWQFRDPAGYCPQMVQECIDEINAKLARLKEVK